MSAWLSWALLRELDEVAYLRLASVYRSFSPRTISRARLRWRFARTATYQPTADRSRR